MNRDNKDQYFMIIADAVASKSTCLKRQLGAVITKDGKIISTGYNGAPEALGGCTVCSRLNEKSGENYDKCRAVHAEMNAIVNAAYSGARTSGAVLYVTDHPCRNCARHIINAGIKEVVVKDIINIDGAKEMLIKAGVKYRVMHRELGLACQS